MKKAGIYTRKGDKGQTSLAGQLRVSKTHQRINALGSLDEMNAAIGLLLTVAPASEDNKFYLSLQSDIFILGAIVGVALARGEELLQVLPVTGVDG
jgi:cob(I)alamin adenosyltransferase